LFGGGAAKKVLGSTRGRSGKSDYRTFDVL
jgi:hypothetical protein